MTEKAIVLMVQMKVPTFVVSSVREVIFAPTINVSLALNPQVSNAMEYKTAMMVVMKNLVQSIQFVVLLVFIVVFKLVFQTVWDAMAFTSVPTWQMRKIAFHNQIAVQMNSNVLMVLVSRIGKYVTINWTAMMDLMKVNAWNVQVNNGNV